MSHQLVQRLIRADLLTTFAELDRWFDRPLTLLHFRPEKGWTIAQVLEHISLTNHFLLLTLDKQTKRAVERAKRGDTISTQPSDLELLNTIGVRGSFHWERPEHMEPPARIRLLKSANASASSKKNACVYWICSTMASAGWFMFQ